MFCDNTTVVQGLRKQFSSKPDIQTKLKTIEKVLADAQASLIVSWLATDKNKASDYLSRA